MRNDKVIGCCGVVVPDYEPPKSWITGNVIRNIDTYIVAELLENRPNINAIARLKSCKARMIIEYKYERSKELA